MVEFATTKVPESLTIMLGSLYLEDESLETLKAEDSLPVVVYDPEHGQLELYKTPGSHWMQIEMILQGVLQRQVNRTGERIIYTTLLGLPRMLEPQGRTISKSRA